MTLNDLVQRVKRRLTADPATPNAALDEIEIMAAVPSGIHELSGDIMRDPVKRNLLQQSYTITLDSSGVGNLLTASGSITSTAGEILQDGVVCGTVIDFDGNLLQYIPNYSDFLRPATSVFAYYTLKDQRIYTRAVSVSVNLPVDVIGAASPLTVVASYAPAAVSSVPTELEDELVSYVTEVVLRKTKPATA